jgi:hypothetical protein
MGRTDCHQWGDSVAAYGEVFMATVTSVRVTASPDLERDGHQHDWT